MADDPIVIDDGGSTRIKKLKNPGSVGAMDGLLTVVSNVGPPAAGRPGSHQTTNAKGTNYGTRVVVTYIDSAGESGTPAGFPVNGFTGFRVSADTYTVQGDLIANPGLKDIRITVSGDPGSDPIVDSKQADKQRRYIVTNTSSITSVEVTPAGGGANVVFDATAPLANGRFVLYTSVTVS
jgi:hypothetical protein